MGSLSAMYFADARQALQEALRVLRPEGKAVYLVWGSFDQPMFRDIIGIIFKFVTPPEDEAGAPSPFRFAEPGSLSTALAGAGFIDVREEAATLPTRFPGDPQQWWRWLVDTAALVQTWMAEMSDADRDRAMEEIHQTLGVFRTSWSDLPRLQARHVRCGEVRFRPVATITSTGMVTVLPS